MAILTCEWLDLVTFSNLIFYISYGFLYITEYLESTESSRWNLLEPFQYVSDKIDISNAETFFEVFKRSLECRSKDPSVLKSAQNKARQLFQQLSKSNPEIVEFLDRQALIIPQVSYMNLFLIFTKIMLTSIVHHCRIMPNKNMLQIVLSKRERLEGCMI